MNTMNVEIENVNTPVVVNGMLDWEVLKWDIQKWNSVLHDEELEFRMGKSCFTQEPQWENTCETLKGTFQDFLEFSTKDNTEWLYFDYKYLNSTFAHTHELTNNIKWDKFGFLGKNANDSVIWIGNKGAHTPCHADTYGCNLVAQIYGSKLWILFPPNQNLKPTRIPYEESSIYSQMNFYSPANPDDYKGLSGCRTVILKPGQVLFVPKGWWHYVENQEISISINMWVPLMSDHENRVEEAITLSLMSSIMTSLNLNEKQQILNTSTTDIPNLRQSVQYLNHHIVKYKDYKMGPKNTTPTHNFDVQEDFVKVLNECSSEEFLELIKKQAGRFKIVKGSQSTETQFDALIRAATDPDVIKLIKRKLLSQ